MVKTNKGYGIGAPLQDVFPVPIVGTRAPTSSDTGYEIGQVWVYKNGTSSAPYMLSYVAAGSATWTLLGVGATGDVDSLTGDSGGAVGPDASGSINIAGGTNITTVGNPGTNTVTYNLDDAITVATSITTPSLASPAGSDLNIDSSSGQDVRIVSSDSSVYILGGSTSVDSVVISATNAAGGVQLNGRASGLSLGVGDGGTLDITGNSGSNINMTTLGPTSSIQIRAQDDQLQLQSALASSSAVLIEAQNAAGGVQINTGTAGAALTGGSLSLTSSSSSLGVKGGSVNDFIGSATLTSGTVTVSKTNVTATNRIFLQRVTVNSSTAIGNLVYTISAGANFTVTSVQDSSPGTTETGDASTFVYFIVDQL